MAEEQLTLLDNMSPALRRIYREATNLNKRIETLKASIKSLEKPLSLSYMRRELKETQKTVQQTEAAIKSMKRAEALNTRYNAFTIGKNGSYYTSTGQRIPNEQMADFAASYVRNQQNAGLRRNRMIYNQGRLVNGMTFEQRLFRQQHPLRFALGNFDRNIRTIHPRLNGMVQDLGVLGGRFNNFGTALATTIGSLWIFNSVIRSIGDVMNNMFIKPQSEYVGNITRIALTNDKQRTPDEMMDQLYDTASRTRAPADATIALYNRIALSGVKASNERIRRFVESFNKVTAISGTTGQENRAVMLQLAQGIGSNRLGGDEFRSISEQAPLFKYMLAKGLNVNPGELKQMGADGKLTAEAILSAMEKVQDQIDQIFKDAPLTIEQTLTIMQNKWDKIINDHLTGYLAIRDVLKDITTWMDTPQGQNIISQMIEHWNVFMMNIASMSRQIFPVIIKFLDKMLQAGISLMPPILEFITWIIDHIHVIVNVLKIILPTIIAIQVAVSVLRGIIAAMGLYMMLVDVLEILGQIRELVLLIAPGFLTWLGPIAAVIAGLGAAILAAKKLNEELDPKHIQQTQKEKNTVFKYEQDMNAYINRVAPAPSHITTTGHTLKLTPEEQARDQEQLNKRAKLLRAGQYALYKTKEDMKYGIYRTFRPDDISGFGLSGIQGMADSSKNVQMPPELGKKGKLKGGHLDSVGRIDDKVSIDNDGIEMMKMIADRQWIMQNEVTVPQNVAIRVTKEADISEESMLASLTNGMKTAVASSMRGAAV